MMMETQAEILMRLKKTLRCNCNLDKWEPGRDTGHSWVCRIHKAAKEEYRKQAMQPQGGNK
jgi:hypothetical protein